MIYFYLASLIFGGGLLAFSLLAGHGDGSSDIDSHGALDGGHSFDVGHSLDAGHSMDVGHSVDSGHSFDSGHEAIIHAGTPGHPEHIHIDASAADAVKLVSFRNFTYFSAFFGLTGVIFDALSVGFFLNLLSSIGMGTFAAAVGYYFVKYIKDTETGEAVNLYNLKGKTGTVVVNVSKERRGKISIQVSNQTIEMLAKASEIADKDVFAKGEEVLIIEIKDLTAFVVQADY